MSHYYGGLTPIPGEGLLPASVRVALSTSGESVSIDPTAPVAVSIDGVRVVGAALGSWLFESEPGAIRVSPPEGLGLAPEIVDARVLTDRRGRPEVVTARLRSAAEVRLTVERGSTRTVLEDWHLREAGVFTVLVEGSVRGNGPIRFRIESRSPDGSDLAIRTIVPPAR